MQSKSHWEQIYATKPATEVNWYQRHATHSLDLIHDIGLAADAATIDVGSGASMLVDNLLDHGYRNQSVLDLSGEALAIAHGRHGRQADTVQWIEVDATPTGLSPQSFDVWHDRTVFHFLMNEADRRAYVRQVMRAVKPSGHVIAATFAPDGPGQGSGRPVMQYDPDSLHDEFGPAFELADHDDESHVTPAGRVQHFIYCHCVKPR